jgi:hypothetical protein
MVDPVDAFVARAQARAHLWAAGEIADLADAVDPLAAVELAGVADDEKQSIMAAAFKPYRHDSPPAPEPCPARRGTTEATVEAIMFGLRRGLGCFDNPGNLARLRSCEADAMERIAARLLDMNALSKGVRPEWSAEDVEKLISMWHKTRGKL